MSPSGFGGNPAGFAGRAQGVRRCTVLGISLDGGPMEGAPVLEPIEHSVLEKPLDGGPMEGMAVLEPLEHSVLMTKRKDGPVVVAPVLVPIAFGSGKAPGRWTVGEDVDFGTVAEFVPDVAPAWGDCSLFEMTVSDPLEHSGLNVTVHVDVDPFWQAPWDAGGTLNSFRLWGLGGLLATSEGHVLWTWTRGCREPLWIFWETTLR